MSEPISEKPTIEEGSDAKVLYVAKVFAGEGTLVLHGDAGELVYKTLKQSVDRPAAVEKIEADLKQGRGIQFADQEFRTGKDIFCVRQPETDASGLA